jgi:hypothetical protein
MTARLNRRLDPSQPAGATALWDEKTGNPRPGACLSGLLLCGLCGERLHAGWLSSGRAPDKRRRTKVRAYECPSRGVGCVRCAVREDALLRRVLEQLATLASPARMRAIRAEVDRLAKAHLAELSRPATKAHEAQLRAKIGRAVENMAVVSKADAAALSAKVSEWRRELEQVEAQRREAEGAAASWEALAAEAERLLRDLAGPDALERAQADPAAFRASLGQLVRAVEVHFERVGPGEEDGRRKARWTGGEVVLAVGGALSFLADSDPGKSDSTGSRTSRSQSLPRRRHGRSARTASRYPWRRSAPCRNR